MLFGPAIDRGYPDDIFESTRMSLGDHIEELRTRLLKAIKGLLFVLVFSLSLDAVGDQLGYRYLGIGRPMLGIIKEPVESQVRDFYAMRNARAAERLRDSVGLSRLTPEELKSLDARVASRGLSDLNTEERTRLMGTPVEMPVVLPVAPFRPVFGEPKDPKVTEIETTISVYPVHLHYLANKGEGLLQSRQYLTTLSVQEGMVVYFKVSLLCGFLLASPWIFFQLWAFVAAGMYPHERRIVRKFLWPSTTLFLCGALLCQFLVLPGAVRALLAFNLWIDMDPELRLNEWLGFAISLPLIFGLSFQTPLVMLFLNRIGLLTAGDFLSKWRTAVFTLAILSAILTPTPDVVTMLYLFVPLLALYFLGILLCYWFPNRAQETESQTAV